MLTSKSSPTSCLSIKIIMCIITPSDWSYYGCFLTLYFATSCFLKGGAEIFLFPLALQMRGGEEDESGGEKMRVRMKTRGEQQGEGGEKKRLGGRR